MPKKVELDINWTTSFGFVLLTDKEYNDIVKQLQTTDKESLDLGYCADGDDYYVDFEKTPAELLDAFNNAEDVSEEDYRVFEKHGCLCGSDIAENIWGQICEELDSEDDEDDEDENDEDEEEDDEDDEDEEEDDEDDEDEESDIEDEYAVPDDMKGDLPLGTERMYNGRKVRLVECTGDDWCQTCVFNNTSCYSVACYAHDRKDGITVQWVYVKE